MLVITNIKKFIFKKNTKEKRYLNFTLLKSHLIYFFKFLLFLILTTYIILAKLNKLTTQTIEEKNKFDILILFQQKMIEIIIFKIKIFPKAIINIGLNGDKE